MVEPLSIDEAFLDLTGMEALVGDATTLGKKNQTGDPAADGLTASVGIAPNKFLAKLASDLQKPDGLVIIPQEEAADFIAPPAPQPGVRPGRGPWRPWRIWDCGPSASWRPVR